MGEQMSGKEKADIADLARGATLDLGCGSRKCDPEAVGIDALALPGVDIVGDVTHVLRGVEDQSVRRIHASHFMEHVPDVGGLMSEVARVLEVGGELEVVVPHFSNAYFYSDPTHETAFGLYSMAYFVAETPMRRKVPVYGDPLPLELLEITMVFKASRPFYGRYALRRCFGTIVNLSWYTKELYEETATGFVSCYELHFLLRRSA